MQTQKFKSTSIREVVDCALRGQPINVQSRELFELSDVDIDDDSIIVDEFSDSLEVESYFRAVAEERLNYEKSESKPESKSEPESESKPEPQEPQEP